MNKINLSKRVLPIFLLLINLSVYASISEYTIQGEFINFENGDLVDLVITATYVTPSGQVSETIDIEGTGKFVIKGKSYKKLNQVWLTIGEIYYGEILVSKDLMLTLNYAKLSKSNVTFYGRGVQFGGSDSEVTILANRWFNFHRKEKQKLNDDIQGVSYLQMSEIQKIDSLNQLFNRLELLESMFLLNYPKDLAWILEDKRKSEHYNQLFLLINKENIYWENLNEALAFTPSILGNSGWLFYKYQSWVLGESYIGKTLFQNWENQEQNLTKLSSHNRDFLIMSAIPDDIEWQEQYLTKFLPYVNQNWVKNYVKERLLISRIKIKEINKEIQEADSVIVNSILGKSHKQFLFGANTYISDEEDALRFIKNIQGKFRDKAIIIDLWATWCAPCISDMKKSKPIKQQLEDLPIEIIYVCTEQGSDVENWDKKIVDTKTKGTHIFINNKLTTSFMEKFELSGYPSYLFFDSSGVYKKNVVQRISSLDIEKLQQHISK